MFVIVSLYFQSDLHRCHMSQQYTWTALAPFVEMESRHWLYSSAIDPLIFCLHGTHNVTSMQFVTLLTLCQLSRPCWWKADLLMTPSATDCLRSDASLHSSVCSLSLFSPFLFSNLSLSLCLWRSVYSPALSAGNCQVQLCLFKIAYTAGSCKRRPGNTSQPHYWFSRPHGIGLFAWPLNLHTDTIFPSIYFLFSFFSY